MNKVWTKEKCIIDAKKYNTITKWIKNSGSAYNALRKELNINQIRVIFSN